ncbi:hypothetical protein CerSpe_244280 [Prunus speciosa]
MEKYSSTIALASALCFSALLGFACCENPDSIYALGLVYCDNCHVGFPTTSSKVIEGAEVQLECSDKKGGAPTYRAWKKTNSEGMYEFEVSKKVNVNSYCEIIAFESNLDDCRNIVHGDASQELKLKFTKPSPNDKRVVAFGNKRFAAPISFQPDQPLQNCAEHHNEEEHDKEEEGDPQHKHEEEHNEKGDAPQHQHEDEHEHEEAH